MRKMYYNKNKIVMLEYRNVMIPIIILLAQIFTIWVLRRICILKPCGVSNKGTKNEVEKMVRISKASDGFAYINESDFSFKSLL